MQYNYFTQKTLHSQDLTPPKNGIKFHFFAILGFEQKKRKVIGIMHKRISNSPPPTAPQKSNQFRIQKSGTVQRQHPKSNQFRIPNSEFRIQKKGCRPPTAPQNQLLLHFKVRLRPACRACFANVAHSASYLEIFLTSSFTAPPGVSTSNTSPTFLPISALPIGDSSEIL